MMSSPYFMGPIKNVCAKTPFLPTMRPAGVRGSERRASSRRQYAPAA